MKKQKKEIFKDPRQLKQKLMAALSMLIVASVLLSTATFAWLVMSISPEVRGISTNVGANGSLEIALLNSETKLDLSTIKSGAVGQSLATDQISANYTWGNLLDVSSESFGLNEIVLMPSRLNATPGAEGYIVNSGMLSVPTYGFDGRITDLTNNTISSVYNGTSFMYTYGQQDYGVRAIGTSTSVTVQGSALAMAQSNISVGQSNANSTASSTWTRNGEAFFQILIDHVIDANTAYDDTDLDVIKAMIADLETSVSYIDSALRNGLVAFGASAIAEEATFTAFNNKVMDTNNSLSSLVNELNQYVSVPAEFTNWIEKLSAIQTNLTEAKSECALLTDNEYTWAEIRVVLAFIVAVEKTYVNAIPYSELGSSNANDIIAASEITLTLAPGSGAFADIADFSGNINSTFNYTAMSKAITVKTESAQNPTYLSALYIAASALEAAGGATNGTSIEMTSTFGYAIDMAFRCNAKGVSNLLLQTDPAERVYDGSESGSTMGGGSFMEFGSNDESMDFAQTIQLMDAIRVGFIDDQGNLLGIAKLNTSNRTISNGMVKAPLYLYDYEISEEAGSEGVLVMGERQKTENKLMSLEQNVAKAITAMVWIDGDIVDNTMVSADSETSLGGVLNLQFATDANLIPADNADLKNLTPDKSSLQKVLETYKSTYEAGNDYKFTSVTWDKFTYAYTYAVSVNNNYLANEAQLLAAQRNLVTAGQALAQLTHDALAAKIAEIRNMMGKTEDEARIVIEDETGKYIAIGSYTNDQKAASKGTIYRVDYANNFIDEGNDVKTPLYTDASWSALAATLYDAEAVNMDAKATEARMDSAISAIEAAKEALQRRVYFTPYDFEGNIYYMAISEEKDTYGKWYDSNFKRVTSDLRILELDARAEAVEIAYIDQDKYVANTTAYTENGEGEYYLRIEPSIKMLTSVYPELSEEDIIAIGWSSSSAEFVTAISQAQIAKLTQLSARATELSIESEKVASAGDIINGNTVIDYDLARINTLIAELEDAIAKEEKRLGDEAAALVTSISADYRVLLSAAIEAATGSTQYAEKVTTTEKDSEGNDVVVETEEYKYADLRTKTEAAQALLAEADPQQAAAETTLTALNDALSAAGLRTYTYDNYIEHAIPVGSERYEIVYAVDNPTGLLYFTADQNSTPTTNLKAVVLTENGVVFTLTTAFEVYTPAKGVEIAFAGATGIDHINVPKNESVTLTAQLMSDVIPHTEEIASYRWASNLSYVTLDSVTKESCKITAKGEATTVSVTLEVTTVQGNTYYHTVPIIIE